MKYIIKIFFEFIIFPKIEIKLTKITFIFNLVFFLFEPNLWDKTQVTVAGIETQLPFYTSFWRLLKRALKEGQRVTNIKCLNQIINKSSKASYLHLFCCIHLNLGCVKVKRCYFLFYPRIILSMRHLDARVGIILFLFLLYCILVNYYCINTVVWNAPCLNGI